MRTVKTRSWGYAALLICAIGCGRTCFAASCAVTTESLNFGAFTAVSRPIEAIGRISLGSAADDVIELGAT